MRTTQHTAGRATDELVETLLESMDLQEKLHQLGSYWLRDTSLAAPAPDPGAGQGGGHSGAAPLEHDFAERSQQWEEASRLGLGHLTRVFGTAPLTVDEGVARLVALQEEVRGRSPHHIPAIAHEECLTGFTALGATVYPAAIAWGATWRPALVREMARAVGGDMRAVGVHQGLAPLLDVVRDYRWGRVEETCGEDPYLVGSLGTAYVQGLQSAGIDATLKHFVAYPASRAGRNHAPVSMGPRELEDVMLVPFEMAVREGGVASVMNSYSDIDGIPVAASHHLLTEVLRNRWGFAGPVVSDYWSVSFLESMHHVARDQAQAAALALRAGLDVELPETTCFAALDEALDRGLLDVGDIDTAVRRVLHQKARLGLLDPEWSPVADVDPGRDLDSPRNRDIARRMAEESVVLLANDGVLPLRTGRRVALVGPSWTDVRTLMGCYAFPNHVLSRTAEGGTGLEIQDLPGALAEELGEPPLLCAGVGFTEGTEEGIAEAVRTAREADVAVVCVGDIAGLFGEGTSGEGCDVVDLDLPGRQGELLAAVLATGTPTVLVLVTGRPYALGEYADRCAAVVQAFMPGVEGAGAIARVLSGAVNPSGRLPVAIPRTRGGQPGTYLAPALGWFAEGISNLDPRPLYPFGSGTSYTTFAYSDPEVSAPTVDVSGTVEYTVTVSNTGDRDGSEVVQLYLTDPCAEVVRPLKQLIGFTKVDLAAGGSARVTFTVHADRFSFTGRDLARIVEPGEVLLSAGHSSEERLEPLVVEVVGARRRVPEGRVLTTPVSVEPL